MISHFDGNPQGPSLSFFSRGPAGCSGTLCVVGAAAVVSFTALLVPFCAWLCVVVVVFGVVLYVPAGAACSVLTPVFSVSSSHGWAFATAA